MPVKAVMNTLYSLLNYRKSGQLGTAEERQRQKTIFLLCGLYCLLAIAFLCAFGIAALQHGRSSYGHVLLGFAGVTALLYALIWISGRFVLANHLVTGLMALLCLYLFITGGEAGTGPLWYFVFPLIALFLQGRRSGSVSILLLFLASVLLVWLEHEGLEVAHYSTPFLQRVAAVYVAVSALGLLFAWFRDESEERLKQSNRQLVALSGYDQLTGLISRRRAEIVLDVEARKHFRYQSRFSLALLRIDHLDQLREKFGMEFGDYVIQEVALLLKSQVRHVDLLSRWEDDMFGILLPATPLQGAVLQAERIRLLVTKQHFRLDGKHARVTLSTGVGEFGGVHIGRFVHDVREQLAFAVSTGGNCVMHADLPLPRLQAQR